MKLLVQIPFNIALNISGELLQKLDLNETGIDDWVGRKLVELSKLPGVCPTIDASSALRQAAAMLKQLDSNTTGIDDKLASLIEKLADKFDKAE